MLTHKYCIVYKLNNNLIKNYYLIKKYKTSITFIKILKAGPSKYMHANYIKQPKDKKHSKTNLFNKINYLPFINS